MNGIDNIQKRGLDDDKYIITICYDGCGWAFPYMAGVTKRIQEHVREFEHKEGNEKWRGKIELRYAGVSAGACVGLAAALGVSMDDMMNEAMAWVDTCRKCPLKTVGAVIDMCGKFIKDDDVVRELKGFALGVSQYDKNYKIEDGKGDDGFGRGRLSKILKMKSLVFSRFNNKEELTNMIEDTCSLPFLNSWSIKKHYYDGGLSRRFFKLPWKSNEIIRISSFKGKEGADLACSVWMPLFRVIYPYRVDILREMFELGYEEARSILVRYNTVNSCDSCQLAGPVRHVLTST